MNNTFSNYGTSVSAEQARIFRNVVFFSLLAVCLALMMQQAIAVDLAALLLDPANPLAAALKTLDSLTNPMKAIAVVVGGIVVLLTLTMLKQFGIIVMYAGVAIFAAVGIPIALKIAGCVI